MNKKKTKQTELKLKNGWIIAVFGVLTLILFYKILSSHVLVYATDQISAGYAFRAVEARVLRTLHQFPFWDPYIFSGMPFIDAFHGDVFYLTALLRVILPTNVVMNWLFIVHTFLAGLFMYMLLLELDINKKISSLFSISYMFAAYSVSLVYSGHDSKVVIFALTPLVFWALHRMLKRDDIRYALLGGVIMGLGLLAPHVQMMYYLYMAVSFYFLYEIILGFIDKKPVKDIVKLGIYYIVMLIASFAVGAVQLIPGYLYTAKYSPRAAGNRGYAFAISWSMPWEDLISAFFAKFSGWLSSYWGRNAFKINSEYIGGFALYGLFLSIFLKTYRKRLGLFFSLIALFFIFMALGGYTPLYKVFYVLLPGVKKFRAPSMSFFLTVFSINILGAMAFSSMENDNDEVFKKLWYTTISIIGLFLIFLVFKSPFISILKSLFIKTSGKFNALNANYSGIPLSFLRAGIIFAVITYILKAAKDWKKSATGMGILALVIVIDLFTVDRQFIKAIPGPSQTYAPDDVVKYLAHDKDIYRVFPLFYRIDENYLMLHNIESVGGHHGNQFQRYQEFLGNPHHFMFRPQEVPNLLKYPKFVDLLNVKYVITQPMPENLAPYAKYPAALKMIRGIKSLLDTENFSLKTYARDIQNPQVVYGIYENKHFMPRVFFVENVRVLPKKQVLSYMESPEFLPSKEAVLEEHPAEYKADTTDTLKSSFEFILKNVNSVKLKFNVSKNCILVYSENFYPKWRAYIDGKETKIYRADYILRAIPVTKGTHTLTFRFNSSIYNKLGLLCIFVVLLTIGLFFLKIKNKEQQ